MTEPKEPRDYLEQAVILVVGIAVAIMILVLHDSEGYKLFCELTKACGE